jgi:site-specific DNA recombinase
MHKERPVKWIVRNPSEHLHIDAVTREMLLQAIARAARWSDEVRSGKVASVYEIAIAKQIGERHICRLLPLAFLAPTIVEAIIDGTAPAGLTVSRMTEALPRGGADQEKMFGWHFSGDPTLANRPECVAVLGGFELAHAKSRFAL